MLCNLQQLARVWCEFVKTTVKHVFRCILILWFPYVENSLHFNLADFQVNFIMQFFPVFFWCLYQMFISKFLSYYQENCILYQGWYSMQINLRWWAVTKICTYLISRFSSNHENCENLMLAKYTCFILWCTKCRRS